MTTKAPIVYLTRRETFSAAHRLWSDTLTEAQNRELFGPCAYDHGHGHNYVLEVTLRGAVDPATGIVVNLKEIRDVMHELIVDCIDHRHLNHDAPLTRGINPTAENLVVLFWQVLHAHYGATLHEVRLRETEKNWVTYTGETT